MKKKKQLTVTDFRAALEDFYDDEVGTRADDLTDEELLNAKLEQDLGMDSLAEAEVTMQLERVAKVSFDERKLDKFVPGNDGSVRRFLEIWSEVIKDN